MGVGLYRDFEAFPDASEVIQLFQIQIQSKNYITKYNANTKSESFSNPNSCHCYLPKPIWRCDYCTCNEEFVAAVSERTWSNV